MRKNFLLLTVACAVMIFAGTGQATAGTKVFMIHERVPAIAFLDAEMPCGCDVAIPVRVSGIRSVVMPIWTSPRPYKGLLISDETHLLVSGKSVASALLPCCGHVGVDCGHVGVVHLEYPEFMKSSAFMRIGDWDVDRIGVLEKPYTPIAWKGDSPEFVYIWTGRSWYQIGKGKGSPFSSAGEIAAAGAYETTRMISGNRNKWVPENSPYLADLAGVWGYRWMGMLQVGGRW